MAAAVAVDWASDGRAKARKVDGLGPENALAAAWSTHALTRDADLGLIIGGYGNNRGDRSAESHDDDVRVIAQPAAMVERGSRDGAGDLVGRPSAQTLYQLDEARLAEQVAATTRLGDAVVYSTRQSSGASVRCDVW